MVCKCLLLSLILSRVQVKQVESAGRNYIASNFNSNSRLSKDLCSSCFSLAGSFYAILRTINFSSVSFVDRQIDFLFSKNSGKTRKFSQSFTLFFPLNMRLSEACVFFVRCASSLSYS